MIKQVFLCFLLILGFSVMAQAQYPYCAECAEANTGMGDALSNISIWISQYETDTLAFEDCLMYNDYNTCYIDLGYGTALEYDQAQLVWYGDDYDYWFGVWLSYDCGEHYEYEC